MGFYPAVATVGNVPVPLPVADGGTDATTAAGALTALGAEQLLATTYTASGLTGFALQDATPQILTWTAPNDGNQHHVRVDTNLYVTSAETGGAIQVTSTLPNGTAVAGLQHAAGLGTGFAHAIIEYLIEPGSTITLQQSSALTVGAATLWAELRGT